MGQYIFDLCVVVHINIIPVSVCARAGVGTCPEGAV